MRLFKCSGAGLCAIMITSPLHSQETRAFTYDALGRLVAVNVEGGPADETSRSYTYDKAGNRVQVAATGAAPAEDPGNGDPGASPPSRLRLYFNGTFYIQRRSQVSQ